MGYSVPTFEQTHSFLIRVWKGLFPLSNVGTRFTYHWKRLRAYAGGIGDLHAHIDSAQRDVMPDSAQGAFLTRWGTILGVVKKGATGARGVNALRVSGVAGSVVTTGDQLQDPATGFTYQVTETATVITPPGYVDVDVSAISTGAATRLNVGTTLNFVAPGAGITATAKIVIALTTDGFDVEQDPAYGVRVAAELAKPRMGGHEDDFVKWALSVTGISSAFAYPNRAGIGTVDVVAFHAGQGTARSLITAEQAALLAYLQSVVPAQLGAVGGALRVLTSTAVPTSVELQVVANGNPAFAFDWDEGLAPPVVLTYTTLTRKIVFTTSLPGSLLASMRIVFRGVASVQDGRVFTVDTISTTTLPNDTITLREQPPVDLAATDVAYAAGPLTAVIRDAILAHMNGEIVYADQGQPIGASAAATKGLSIARLRILADALGPSNPGGIYGTWNGDLLRANLFKIAMFPTGARNVAIVTPAADAVTADNLFPADAATNFITPNMILVRKG